MAHGQLPNGGGLTRSLVGVFSSAVEEFKALGHWSIGNTHLSNAAKLLILSPVLELARRGFMWVMERFRLSTLSLSFCVSGSGQYIPEYSISARFLQGDPAFEWLTLFMVSISSCLTVTHSCEPGVRTDMPSRVLHCHSEKLQKEVGRKQRDGQFHRQH